MDCRMFVSSGDREFNSRLYRALLFASERDVFMENRSHDSGWGMAILSPTKEIYWRGLGPIFEYIIPSSIFPERSYVMFHARLASTGEPVKSADDSHPYRVNGEETVYIAHNGHVKKEILGKEFGIKVDNKTDTEVLAFILSIMDGDATLRIRKMIETVHDLGAGETLNLLFLVNRRYSYRILYYSEFSSREKYLTMFRYSDDSRFAVMSSTVAYYLNMIDLDLKSKSEKVEPVETSKLMEA